MSGVLVGRFVPKLLAAVSASLFFTASVHAAAVYPIDRASFLAGSVFDLKIELDQSVEQKDIQVTLNGQAISSFIKKAPEFIANEDGKGSSLIYRDITIDKAGAYKLVAKNGADEQTVNWDVYSTGPRKAKNVILFIGDGMTIANRTAARIMSKGIAEGKYFGKLSFDDMSNMALIGTSGVDSVITDSANSASAYTTGHKTSVNAMGVYVSRNKDNLAHPKVETITELLKRTTKMSVGIVSDAEIVDATPGAMVAHTRRRADKQYIADQLLFSRADVILGGGMAYFLPKGVKGSKRQDDNDMVSLFKSDGYAVSTTRDELLTAAKNPNTKKLFGGFHLDNMDGSLDRFFLKQNTVKDFPNQPDLTDMTQAALDTLSKNKDGFFLMVEAGLIDKFNHPLDWERAAYDTIMLSNAVERAKQFAAKNPDTLIIVVPDHTHSGSINGTINDTKQGALRDKVGVYSEAGYPNYPKANADGYPESVDVSKRLAYFYSNYPDHYETMSPKLDGTFVPAVKGTDGKFVANEKYKLQQEAAIKVEGNLPSTQEQGVHTADDAVLTANGPGADRFKGFMDNTEVFRVIVESLGLGSKVKK